MEINWNNKTCLQARPQTMLKIGIREVHYYPLIMCDIHHGSGIKHYNLHILDIYLSVRLNNELTGKSVACDAE